MVSTSRVAGVLLSAFLLGLFLAEPALPLLLAPAECLDNGNFEASFDSEGVGAGWSAFSNGGRATYDWSGESASHLLWDGSHAQRVAISTMGHAHSDRELYAGIYQRVLLIPGRTYKVTLRGAILESAAAGATVPSTSRRAQWGWARGTPQDARAVEEWIDLPWRPVMETGLPALSHYQTTFIAPEEDVTFFLRLVKQDDSAVMDLSLIVDGLSLCVYHPGSSGEAGTDSSPSISLHSSFFPTAGKEHVVAIRASAVSGITRLRLYANGELAADLVFPDSRQDLVEEVIWIPPLAGAYSLRAEAHDPAGGVGYVSLPVTVGEDAEWMINPFFSEGFDQNGVALDWSAFRGGPVSFLPAVKADEATGKPQMGSQLIILQWLEAMTKQPVQDSPMAGIYQRVEGLRLGATYHVSVSGYLDWSSVADQAAPSARLEWALLSDDDGVMDGNDDRVDWMSIIDDTPADFLVDAGSGVWGYDGAFVARSTDVVLFLRVSLAEEGPAGEMRLHLSRFSLRGYR